jgi:hypothetical protein
LFAIPHRKNRLTIRMIGTIGRRAVEDRASSDIVAIASFSPSRV